MWMPRSTGRSGLESDLDDLTTAMDLEEDKADLD